MRTWYRFVAAVLVALSLLSFRARAQQSVPPEVLAYADMVFYNGPVLTVDDQFTIAEAIAVRDGKILAVGASDAILKLAGPKTLKVDLQRTKAVIPGVIKYAFPPAALRGQPLLELHSSGRAGCDSSRRSLWRF